MLKTCPNCNGNGFVTLIHDLLPKNEKYEQVECYVCHGRGYVEVPDKKKGEKRCRKRLC